jgi:hypothetical protein
VKLENRRTDSTPHESPMSLSLVIAGLLPAWLGATSAERSSIGYPGVQAPSACPRSMQSMRARLALSGAVNPALTIMANALRVGDHLLARMS